MIISCHRIDRPWYLVHHRKLECCISVNVICYLNYSVRIIHNFFYFLVKKKYTCFIKKAKQKQPCKVDIKNPNTKYLPLNILILSCFQWMDWSENENISLKLTLILFIKDIHIHIQVLILSFSYILNYFLYRWQENIVFDTLTELHNDVLDKIVCIP